MYSHLNLTYTIARTCIRSNLILLCNLKGNKNKRNGDKDRVTSGLEPQLKLHHTSLSSSKPQNISTWEDYMKGFHTLAVETFARESNQTFCGRMHNSENFSEF